MSLPAGFYRANGPLMGKSPPLAGGPLTPDPWQNPLWPAFLRAAARPTGDIWAGLPNPSLEGSGWRMYCGPVELRHWQAVLGELQSLASQAGWVLTGEPILVHPHSQSYPWPTWQTRCYPWQWEAGRPKVYTAYWDTVKLTYV